MSTWVLSAAVLALRQFNASAVSLWIKKDEVQRAIINGCHHCLELLTGKQQNLKD